MVRKQIMHREKLNKINPDHVSVSNGVCLHSPELTRRSCNNPANDMP